MRGSQAKTRYLSELALLMALSLWQGCGQRSEHAEQHAPPAGTAAGAGGGSGGKGGSAGEGSGSGGEAAGSSGGSSGASGTASDGGERPDFPPRPTWTPRFPLGAPGWRGSTVPFCSEDVARLEPRIWSTDGAVYLRVYASCNSLAGDPCNLARPATGPIESLYRNDGSGWQRIYRREPARDAYVGAIITGYQDGRLVISDENCPLLQIDLDGGKLCLWSEQSTFVPRAAVTAGDVLVVLGTYATESVPAELWKHDGTAWAKLQVWTADPPSASLHSGRPRLSLVSIDCGPSISLLEPALRTRTCRQRTISASGRMARTTCSSAPSPVALLTTTGRAGRRATRNSAIASTKCGALRTVRSLRIRKRASAAGKREPSTP